jgi:hypothetical protein
MNDTILNRTNYSLQKLGNSNGLIHSTGYNKNKQSLEIALFDGTIYQYFEVPSRIYDEFLHTDKPDEFYRKNIRNHYRRLFKRYSFWV